MSTQEERMKRARISLEGLSVGDAFGEQFFMEERAAEIAIDTRQTPTLPQWRWTDDTAMAIAICEVLLGRAEIAQDELAKTFGFRYLRESGRGYGPAMHTLLPMFVRGADWREETKNLFRGQGSFGNGAAMRVAPLGAYFADDLEACVENARRSAEVTHAHDEGIAGAIAVAVAAAWAWRLKTEIKTISARAFLDLVLPSIPGSEVRQGVLRAQQLDEDEFSDVAADVLGSGQNVTAQDTVPFVLWCAANFLENYEEALWQTVAGLGDRDTTCAMVGGIVALSSRTPIPGHWLARREALPKI